MNFNDVIEIRDKLKQAGIEDSKVNSFITSYATRIGDETNARPKVETKAVYTKDDITSVDMLRTYVNGSIVNLPPFGDNQPFVAMIRRPSLLALAKTGKIPNSLLNQATALFASGTNSLNKGDVSLDEIYDIMEVVVEAALVSPTMDEIKSAGLELSDDQLMAIFSYTQTGISALEPFRQ